MTILLWRYSRPNRMQLTTSLNSPSVNRLPSLKYDPTDPQRQYSITIYSITQYRRLSPTTRHFLGRRYGIFTMKGDSHSFSIWDSLSISLSSRVILTFLMATTLPVVLSSAAYTSPKRLQVKNTIQYNPSPILPLISKSLLEQPLIEMESMRKKKVRKGNRCSLFTYLYQFVSRLVNTLTAFFPSSSSQSDDWFLVSCTSSLLYSIGENSACIC